MSMTWPEAETWTIRGIGTAVTLESGGALLIAGAAGAALAQPIPISREMAERIGTAEHAQRAKLLEAADGAPVALPTPSPFLSEQYVHSLPTQAQLDAHPRPLSMPGAAPHLPSDENALEARRVYPAVDSNQLTAGAKALGDTNRCFPDFESFTGNSQQASGKLRDVLQPSKGWEMHHLVEQARTDDFGTQAIQNTANVVNLPSAVHAKVSDLYSRAPTAGSEAFRYKIAHPEAKISTVRDWVKTLPYESQRQFSIEAVRQAMDEVKSAAHERAAIDHDLQKLENPTLCPPEISKIQRTGPDLATVSSVTEQARPGGADLLGNLGVLWPPHSGNTARSVLHIFKNGHEQAVGAGYHQTGKIHNVGSLIAQEHDNGGSTSITMYSRRELIDNTPNDQKAALNAALRDGHKVEINIGNGGIAVHDVTPSHQLAPSVARQRSIEQPGKGHEIGL